MNSTVDFPVAGDASRSTITQQIIDLLSRLYPEIVVERRHDDRVAIPVLFSLVPLDVDRQPLECESMIVVGKNISRRGLSFYHERPMPYRQAVIGLANPGQGSFSAEIDVSWCRFTSPGWYQSGGRLVRPATPLHRLPHLSDAASGSSQLAGVSG